MLPDPTTPVAVLAIAVVVDQILGEYPNPIHPVVWMGTLVSVALRAAPTKGWWVRFLFGLVLTVGLVALCVGVTMLLDAFTSPYPVVEILVSAYFLKASFAFRELGKTAGRVEAALTRGDLAAARQALLSLCSRDPTHLDGEALAAGAIASVAENASDSLVAPLFYFALFGVPGAVAYRAINTLDAMIGYRGEYEALGKFAARFDDVANWIPARLTTGFLLVTGWLLGLSVRNGWRVVRRDGARTPSPNGGKPMAAMAGLLGVALEKPGVYVLGDAREPVTSAKIAQARRVLTLSGWLALTVTALTVVSMRALVRVWWPAAMGDIAEAFLLLVFASTPR